MLNTPENSGLGIAANDAEAVNDTTKTVLSSSTLPQQDEQVNMMDTALAYARVGLSVIPTNKATKAPAVAWKEYQGRCATEDELRRLFGHGGDSIGIVTGAVSGNLELIDFDNQGELFPAWTETVEQYAPGLASRLLVERSQSGGKHVVYRCPGISIPKSSKLAMRGQDVTDATKEQLVELGVSLTDEKAARSALSKVSVKVAGKGYAPHRILERFIVVHCLIETRGEGGQFLAAPSPGYVLEQGSYDCVPEVSPDEREIMMDAARALNEWTDPSRVQGVGHAAQRKGMGKPGEDYNDRGNVVEVLQRHGWEPEGPETARDGTTIQHYRRPGKARGVSATLLGGKKLYVFTSNGSPLQAETSYSPFAVYAELEHGGDYAAACRALAKDGYGEQAKGTRRGGGGLFPFVRKADGIYARVEDKDGNVEWEWVCSPLDVLAMTRSDQGNDWGRLLTWTDSDGVEHRWPLPMEMMAGSGEEYRRELLSMGLLIATGKGKERLHNYLTWSRPEARVRCVSRIGWHGRRFVLPDASYGQDGDEEVILQGGSGDTVYRTLGTLEEWQEHVARICVGNSRLVLAVSVALAAPLLYLGNAESGGFHYIGSSSIGKTSTLRVAGSVCGGGGIRGYIRQWRATDNGLESIAAAHCDTALCLDEMGQVDGKAAGEIAYMLANGQGKTRARRDGRGRSPQDWRVLFLSTGEIGLADKVAEDGRSRSMAGQAVRVVDIVADAGKGLGVFENLHGFSDGAAFSRHVQDMTERFYGTALRAFLEKLMPHTEGVFAMLSDCVRKFSEKYCPQGADGQVVRVCERFGLVAAAGELAVNLGVLPWPQREAMQAAATCFSSWLERRGGTGAAEIRAGIEQVRSFFEMHGSSRFETAWEDRDNAPRTANRAGFRRLNDDKAWEYYVLPVAYKDELCRGFDTRLLTQELLERGLLIPGADGKSTVSIRVPGEGKRLRLYRFSPDILADAESQD